MEITVGARASRLAQEQVFEVWKLISVFHPDLQFHPVWTITEGDIDRTTPLWKVSKTDFFTQQIDEKLLQGEFRIAIHSAKDLPTPLPKGLSLIALTEGVDPRDSLVMNPLMTVATLPPYARIGTSSKRREAAVKRLRQDLLAIDIRGTIDERLEQLHTGSVDGVIIAEAALIRLKLTHENRIFLDCETEPLQGKLAVIARADDGEMASLFAPIDTRKRIAVVGPSIPKCLVDDLSVAVIHTPLIHLQPLQEGVEDLCQSLMKNLSGTGSGTKSPEAPSCLGIQPLTWTRDVILTSKHAASFFYEALHRVGPFGKDIPKQELFVPVTVPERFFINDCDIRFFCVGEATASATRTLFPQSEILTARDATQEGVVELILAHRPKTLMWPRSTHARRYLPEALEKAGLCLTEIPLYTPVPSSSPCSLEGIDTVFFTCPSSVDAFFDLIEKSTWERLSLQAIGPVTQARLTALQRVVLSTPLPPPGLRHQPNRISAMPEES
jgi:hydroxymethylbilane synthase